MSSETSELETLCQSCGLCCDGTLFQKVLLRPEELEPAKKHGLHVVENKGFLQPCPKLVERSCSIYEHRPSVCKSFTCRLFARHRDEGGPLAARLDAVQRMRELLATLKGYGLTRSADGEVRFEAEGVDAFSAMEAFGELMQRMEEDFARYTPPAKPVP